MLVKKFSALFSLSLCYQYSHSVRKKARGWVGRSEKQPVEGLKLRETRGGMSEANKAGKNHQELQMVERRRQYSRALSRMMFDYC